jgi:hypothetical protein
MPEELVTTAWQRGFWAQPPTPKRLVHSDRGGQYGGNAYRKLLARHGAVRSQSRRGECYEASATTMPKRKASGHGSKRRYWSCASGPFLPIWPMRKPMSRPIVTSIITSARTPALATRRPLTRPNSSCQLPP